MNAPLGPTRWYYDTLVPKDPWKLVDFRKWLLEKCWSDPEIAAEVWIICSRDILFYINFAGWLLEPRDKARWQPSRVFGGAREIPFITRDYQNDAILRMQSELGMRDMSIVKSREVGATWMVMYLFDWAWRFHAQMHFGVVSKDEDSAGNSDDPDSLLSKLEFIEQHLPGFLRPDRDWNKSKMTIANRSNGSTITAYACTGNMARGGRKRAFWCDEMHAWPTNSDYAALDSLQHVTQCRIMGSTPNRDRGQSGAFFDVIQNDEADMARFELSWMIDKNKAAGLYRSNGNTIEYLDPSYVYPQDYKFIRDGKTRSPYYDYECSRPGATEQSIAAELDMNFGGATSRFFQPHVIFKARVLCKDPTHLVEVRMAHGQYLPELCQTDNDNAVELWIDPTSGLSFTGGKLNVPEGRSYAMGVDVAYGTGSAFSSCSAFSIIDKRTTCQVAEYRYNKIAPENFAQMCAAVGQAFNHAIMCIEVTGVGQMFLGKILQIGYTNLWFRPASKDDIRQNISRRVGYDNKDGGYVLLGELQHALQREAVTIRSRRAIDECERYYIDSNGNLKHPLVGKGRTDAPEKSHGDCAVSCAAAWFAIHEEPEFVVEKAAEEEIPYGSFAWRQKQHAQSQRKATAYWDPYPTGMT